MRIVEKESYCKEDTWLEFLEEELDSELQDDLKLLLKNSLADRRILESLESTRKSVERSGEVALPEDGRYYDKLHDKIMASIDSLDQPAAISTLRQKSGHWVNIFGTAVLSILVAVASLEVFKVTHSSDVSEGSVASHEAVLENQSEEQTLAMLDSSEQLALAQNVVGYGGDLDFMSDVVDQRIRAMDPVQARELMKRLVR